MTAVYDFEDSLAHAPADVQAAVAAAKVLLGKLGLPPCGADGVHQVLVAFAMPGGVAVELLAFADALEALKDPELHPFLHRAQAQLEGAVRAVVLLAVGEGGSFWCAPIGEHTGNQEAACA
jgi:hypothetical protein